MIWILAIVSAVCYRIGGAGKEEISWAKGIYRDIGCSLAVLAWLLTNGFVWYLSLATGVLVFFMVKTYHDWTGADNFYLHGIGLGLAMTPLYWSGAGILAIALYTVILGLSMGVWHWLLEKFKVPGRVWWDELFRGFVLLAAMRVLSWGGREIFNK